MLTAVELMVITWKFQLVHHQNGVILIVRAICFSAADVTQTQFRWSYAKETGVIDQFDLSEF